MGISTIAAATLGAGAIGALGAESAANKQANTAQNIENQQLAAGQQGAGYFEPYLAMGKNALSRLNQELPYLTTPYAPTVAQLEQTPGYQFALNQGLKSVQNSAAAKGLGVSGAAMKGAAKYATGLAQNTYAQNAGIYQQNQQIIGNELNNLIAQGRGAAAGASGAITGQSNAAAGTGLTGAGAQAAGTVGMSNALAGGLQGAANTVYQGQLINALMQQNNGKLTPGMLTAARGF